MRVICLSITIGWLKFWLFICGGAKRGSTSSWPTIARAEKVKLKSKLFL